MSIIINATNWVGLRNNMAPQQNRNREGKLERKKALNGPVVQFQRSGLDTTDRETDPSSAVFVSSAKEEIKITSYSLVCRGVVGNGDKWLHTLCTPIHTHTFTILMRPLHKNSSWYAQDWKYRITHRHTNATIIF